MTEEQRLVTFISALRVAVMVMQEHEALAVLRFALREVTPEQLERLATAVAYVEANESFECYGLGTADPPRH